MELTTNLRKRFSFIFNVLRLYFKCWCCYCCFYFTLPIFLSLSLSLFALLISVYRECVFWNPSAHANRMWNEPFSCCIYYICLKTCHVGIYLVNQIMPRNDMLMKWQSVYNVYIVFAISFTSSYFGSLFYVFFATKRKYNGKCKNFPLRKILIQLGKIYLLSRKFWDRRKKQQTKEDRRHSFNAWWPILKITSA